MTIIKCKMCGGDIQRSEDQAYGTCDSCGSTMTFPKVSDDQRTNLFNRANHFRRQGEFDKAIATYETILNLDDSDAEAHWGAVLSRYGIEYVEDPVSHERIPTCRRAQLESILTDADYQAALEYAPDGYSRSLYEEEAKRIADIQKGILALSSQEKPYDVFICYKETTDAGTRTPDSTLAQDVYYQLTQEGYKVFFSRITLEDKLGQQYEPYIFAALNSAKVMVVISTQAEYFDAVWVKNEWSRFLALMKKDRSKLLIPCYRGMDVYDLPEELSMLQSQDMGKIGFMQDLLRGIKKVVDAGKATPAAAEGKTPMETVAAPGIQSLLTRAQLFLEDGDFKSATDYADRVLDIDPKYAPAYLVRLQAGLGLRYEEDLGKVDKPLDGYADYQKALRFAEGSSKDTYGGYNKSIQQRLVEERKEILYNNACTMYREAKDEAGYLQAYYAFRSISGYKDANERSLVCQSKVDESRARKRKDELEKAALLEQQEIEAGKAEERRQSRNKKILLVTVIMLLVSALSLYIVFSVIVPSNNYKDAMAYLNSGKYTDAIEAFVKLGAYKDSKYQLQETHLQYGKYLLDQGSFFEAAQEFNQSGEGIAASELYKESMYRYAQEEIQEGNFIIAANILDELGSYEDSQSLVLKYSNYLVKKGKSVLIGTYDNKKIEWLVLDTKENKALLLAQNVLFSEKYKSYSGDHNSTWGDSSLQSHVNNSFYEAAFTPNEKDLIVETQFTGIYDSDKTSYNSKTETVTWLPDYFRFFILNKNEINKYLPTVSSRALPQSWWVRDGGENTWGNAVYVDTRGSFQEADIESTNGVRPAMWIIYK